VETANFNYLAGGFGTSQGLFSKGNFNVDDRTDSIDFSVFREYYGVQLPESNQAQQTNRIAVT